MASTYTSTASIVIEQPVPTSIEAALLLSCSSSSNNTAVGGVGGGAGGGGSSSSGTTGGSSSGAISEAGGPGGIGGATVAAGSIDPLAGLTTFQKLARRSEAEVMDHFFDQSRIAEDNREVEWRSAQHLQGLIHMCQQLKSVRALHAAASDLQGIWRANQGRKILDALLVEAEKKRRMNEFNRCATIIQRVWRGHRSRKSCLRPDASSCELRNNMKVRRTVLEQIAKRNQEWVLAAGLRAKEEAKAAEMDKTLEYMKQFEEETSKMHYLVGTDAKPGIWGLSTVIVDQIPLEEHLKKNPLFRVQLKESIQASQHRLSTTNSTKSGSMRESIQLPPVNPSKQQQQQPQQPQLVKHISAGGKSKSPPSAAASTAATSSASPLNQVQTLTPMKQLPATSSSPANGSEHQTRAKDLLGIA